MTHPPKQLVLLLSLIGTGVSACAHVRIESHVDDALQSLSGVGCNEAESATPWPSCDLPHDLIWQPRRSAVDLTGSTGVLVLYGTAARDDWAPGEVAGSVASTALPPPAAEPLVPEASRSAHATRHAGKPRHLRLLASATATLRAATSATLAKIDGKLVERIEPLPSAELATPPSPGSVEVERLLITLADVLAEGSARPAVAAVAAVVDDVALAVDAPGVVERLQTVGPARLDHREVFVESQSGRVLLQLGAILSDQRDEVGATLPSATPPVVSTHSGKVMAMLHELAAARAPTVEDGATRRLRKLAARDAQAQAEQTPAAAPPTEPAAASAEAAKASDDGAGEVDLLLPLSVADLKRLPPHAFETVGHIAMQAQSAPAALTSPGITGEPRRVRAASPFGDRQVAVSATSLDRVRGGFASDGLNISFGIERAIYVNGSLVTTTSMNVVDLGQVSAGRGTAALDSGTIALIQNGAGNVVAGGSISSAAMGTVVQNTLDGQKIQNVTTINATANSLGLYRSLNLGSSLRGAVIDSLRR